MDLIEARFSRLEREKLQRYSRSIAPLMRAGFGLGQAEVRGEHGVERLIIAAVRGQVSADEIAAGLQFRRCLAKILAFPTALLVQSGRVLSSFMHPL